MQRRPLLQLLLASPLFFARLVHAEGPTAAEIADRLTESSAFSWEGAKTRMRMTLIEKGGSRKDRVMEILGRRQGGLLQTVVRFLVPADIAGTAFLMLDRGEGRSEQHIYLPRLKRTRRIAGREREGSFMGSDFSFADLRRADARQAEHKRLPDEVVGEEATFVIDSIPRADVGSPYSRVRTWARQSDFVPLRTQFFDQEKRLLKTLYAKRVRKLDGKPVVAEAQMKNEQTGHSTELVIEAIERREDLSDADFTPNALAR